LPNQLIDLLIRGGTVYDGTGAEPVVADVGIVGDRISAIGALGPGHARQQLDAGGLAVAPGFINSLSWATESLLADPNAESDLRQGVTLEVFGEGTSMGPLTPQMRSEWLARQTDFRFDISWTTLGEYLEHLERRGLVPNVASFVGAASVRMHELGRENRAPTAAELARMCKHVRQAMREGALGLGASLIYMPDAYADTAELKAMARAAAEYGGGYAVHLRSETARLLPALDEALEIGRTTGTHVEIYHLKAAGQANWPLLPQALDRIEAVRAEGLDVAANMYPYTAAATGFDAAMPPWVQEGGTAAWIGRLSDPAIRSRVVAEIAGPPGDWENFYAAAGSPERISLIGFRREALKSLTGKTLAEVAASRGRSPIETMIDLVIEDGSRVTVAYTMMSEENLRLQVQRPWISLCSDEESPAPRGAFLNRRPHPRAYGSFARFLGHYVRREQLISLPEAVRRLTSLPAHNFRLRGRGTLAPGFFADLVVFDPGRVEDHATFADPHRFASGVEHVVVNGQPVLRAGRLTGARPGRVVRGFGWSANASK
jgi:N-acyl-D-amino-acid deacylase